MEAPPGEQKMSTSGFPNNRRDPRFAVDIDAQVTAGDLTLQARSRDISRSGLCLITGEALSPGTEINVSLVLSFGDNAFSEPLSMGARVVWCTPLFGSFQVGAMFTHREGDEEMRFLDMFIRYLDGTGSRPGVASLGEEDDEEDIDDPFRP